MPHVAESLERRTLLSAAVVLVGDAGADSFYVLDQGDTVAFYHNATPAAGGSPVQVVPIADLGSVVISGGGGDDTLTIDYAGQDNVMFPAGISFDGGTPATSVGDRLVIANPPDSDVQLVGGDDVFVGSSSPLPLTYANVTSIGFDTSGEYGATYGLDVDAGGSPVTIDTDLGTNGADVDVDVAYGAALTFAAAQHLGGLSIGPGSGVTMAAGSGRALVTNTLSVAGTLDLTDDDLIVDAPSAAAATALQEAVGAGYATPGVDGTIDSGVAAAFGHELGVAPVADLNGPPATVDGQPLPAGALLARYTLPGDANLDGFVSGADFAALATHFDTATGTAPPAWYDGDFNYDGYVTAVDFTALATHFNQAAGASPRSVVVGQNETFPLPPVAFAVARWDVDWGDGTADSLFGTVPAGTAPAPAVHGYADPGTYLVQYTAVLPGGTTYYAPATLAVASGTAATVDAVVTAAATTDDFTVAADGAGDTVVTDTTTGTVYAYATASLHSLTVQGNTAGDLTLDPSLGDPLPAGGLGYGGGTLTVDPPDPAAPVVATDSATFVGDDVVRHLDTTAVRLGGPGTLAVAAGTVSVAGDDPDDSLLAPADSADDATASGGESVLVGPGATALFTGTTTLADLDVAAGGTARMAPDGTHVLDTAALALEPAAGDGTTSPQGGVLDLADDDLIVRADAGQPGPARRRRRPPVQRV